MSLEEKISLGEKIRRGIKKGLIAVLTAATIIGTLGGNKGGFPLLYNRLKPGTTWGGIRVGIVNKFTPGSKFYGIVIGVGNLTHIPENDSLEQSNMEIKEPAEIYGLEFAVICNEIGNDIIKRDSLKYGIKIYGAQGGIVYNKASEVYGAQISEIGSVAEKVNGLQFSLIFNGSEELHGAKIGAFNYNKNNNKWGLGIQFSP